MLPQFRLFVLMEEAQGPDPFPAEVIGGDPVKAADEGSDRVNRTPARRDVGTARAPGLPDRSAGGRKETPNAGRLDFRLGGNPKTAAAGGAVPRAGYFREQAVKGFYPHIQDLPLRANYTIR
jgi:hypothetical protein